MMIKKLNDLLAEMKAEALALELSKCPNVFSDKEMVAIQRRALRKSIKKLQKILNEAPVGDGTK